MPYEILRRLKHSSYSSTFMYFLDLPRCHPWDSCWELTDFLSFATSINLPQLGDFTKSQCKAWPTTCRTASHQWSRPRQHQLGSQAFQEESVYGKSKFDHVLANFQILHVVSPHRAILPSLNFKHPQHCLLDADTKTRASLAALATTGTLALESHRIAHH